MDYYSTLPWARPPKPEAVRDALISREEDRTLGFGVVWEILLQHLILDCPPGSRVKCTFQLPQFRICSYLGSFT